MNTNPLVNEIPGQTANPDERLNSAGVLEHAQSLWVELCKLSQDHFLLAALETQRAGESLVDMLVAGVMIAMLMISAWLGLMAAAVLVLIEQGWVASSAILCSVVGNVLLALICYGMIRRKRVYLRFPATRRSFQSLPKTPSDVKQ